MLIHAGIMGEIRTIYRILVKKPQKKRQIGKLRHRWEYVKMDFTEKDTRMQTEFIWLRVGACFSSNGSQSWKSSSTNLQLNTVSLLEQKENQTTKTEGSVAIYREISNGVRHNIHTICGTESTKVIKQKWQNHQWCNSAGSWSRHIQPMWSTRLGASIAKMLLWCWHS
jgi:hypothetical protein